MIKEQRTTITNFEEIIRQNQTIVFRTAMGFVHNKEDAEDLTQDVFINAYRSFKNFRGDAELSTWLYRITVNLALNYIAKKQRKRFFSMTESTLKNLFNTTSSDKTPYQQLEAAERDSFIQQAIDKLPNKQRTAFVLSKYDDLSQKQIANVMGITEGAVEQLLQRAKTNLQKKLDYYHRK